MNALWPLLMPLSWIFGWLVAIREFLYAKKIFKQAKLDCPVISVGNLTVGGTGKTPFVDVLIKNLRDKGVTVGVLSRGYGRKSTDIVEVTVAMDPAICGDEPLWLKQNNPDTQIIVGANRVEAAKLLVNPQVIVLDDGMQHLQVHRDLEITLIDTSKPASHYRLLPWGRAREPLSALRRSDFAILTKINLGNSQFLEEIVDRVFDEGVLDVLESQTVFDTCYDLKSRRVIDIQGKKTFLMSGIANPASFEETVKSQKVQIVRHHRLPDHAEINETLAKQIMDEAKGCDLILMTEKDAIKWSRLENLPTALAVGVVRTQMIFNPELPSFYDLVSHSNH